MLKVGLVPMFSIREWKNIVYLAYPTVPSTEYLQQLSLRLTFNADN